MERVHMADHHGSDYALATDQGKDGRDLAFIIVSALLAANEHPDGAIDLNPLVEKELERRSQ